MQVFGWKPYVVRPRYSGMDLMKSVIADPKSGVLAFVKHEFGVASLESSDDDSEDDDDVCLVRLGTADAGGLYTFIMPGVQPLQVPAFPSAFAMKAGGSKAKAAKKKVARMTAKQADFTQWCYNRGVKEKTKKIGPARAEALMPLLGTAAGAALFPGDGYWLLGCE